MVEPISIRPDYTALSTEALAKLAHNRGNGPYRADQELALLVAEMGRRIVALETQVTAHVRFTEHVARIWTKTDTIASGAEPDDDALATLDHHIGRAREITGIVGPEFDADGELVADAGYPAKVVA